MKASPTSAKIPAKFHPNPLCRSRTPTDIRRIDSTSAATLQPTAVKSISTLQHTNGTTDFHQIWHVDVRTSVFICTISKSTVSKFRVRVKLRVNPTLTLTLNSNPNRTLTLRLGLTLNLTLTLP